jgi:hypothetical protein
MCGLTISHLVRPHNVRKSPRSRLRPALLILRVCATITDRSRVCVSPTTLLRATTTDTPLVCVSPHDAFPPYSGVHRGYTCDFEEPVKPAHWQSRERIDEESEQGSARQLLLE